MSYFPKSKEMVLEFARDKSSNLSAKIFRGELSFLPALERQSREDGTWDDGSTRQTLLARLIEKPSGTKIVWKMMYYLELKWDRSACQKGDAWSKFMTFSMS
jgi:hypothetical protein|mmetsp:Transcript_20174/g.43479  ORF Transcript_20174/g.43479 Transcript_20174/m.43479 type:complete len:102 (-) Transcript_20174:1182-1487(-)